MIAAVAAFALAGSVIAPAQAVSANTSSIRSSVSPAVAAPRATVPCEEGKANHNRTELCMVERAVGVVLDNGRPVGGFSFTVTHKMKLKIKSLKWSEAITISDVTLVRNASGIRVGLAVGCGGTCKATSRFPQQRILGTRDISGKVNFTDTVAKNQHNTTTANYILSYSKPGFTIDTNLYASAPFRCDDTFWNRDNTRRTQRAGCVFPEFTPTLETMKSLPWIAKNIRDVQARGGHYGKMGAGPPLHREADRAKADQNRRAVCGGQRPPAQGLSCDEYPFATTKEGGTALPPISRGIAWVPNDEQDAQGGRINAFHKQQRLLDNDAFWVEV
ncbi:NucA/NucB deoxyribonuclease domain-containing protein [Streptomyces bluensis]|uniref:NucA/NucB deoxyribonuclease domain-containing protein n=1 Tax=Streptomyces bluensis TaxID=33897 RepID=A0ABW6UXC6_9ACTN